MTSSTVVETVLFSAQDGRLRFRTRRAELPHGAHPDALARSLTGLADGLLHSTSWRFEGGRVILTYAALPDPDPARTLPLDPSRPLPYAADPLAPASAVIDVADVAAHACRHLAYLRQTDPVVALAALDDPQLWDLVADSTPAMGGLLVQPA
ncbi:hypothetical protein AB0M47_26710 [Hamadaea sp. NPDC051192]|uniref:hypothetical protein n=1 Tax=Hamadaea sp. NPDC051192 TaxID=3154940 RepID=UPI00343D0C2D